MRICEALDNESRLEAPVILPGEHPSHAHECLGANAFSHRGLNDMVNKPALELFVLCGRKLLALFAIEVLELDFSALLGTALKAVSASPENERNSSAVRAKQTSTPKFSS